MSDYAHAWKTRLMQIVIVNIVFVIIGIIVSIKNNDVRIGCFVWIFGSWVVEALVSTFTKGGGRISSLALSAVSSLGLALGTSDSGSFIWIWFAFKALFVIVVLSFLITIEFFMFPFTTIYYFVKRNA